MLKILQARLQQYVNCELPDVQAGFRKGRRTRDQIANIRWIIEKAREFQKNIYFCFIDYAKAFDCVDHNKLWSLKWFLYRVSCYLHMTFLPLPFQFGYLLFLSLFWLLWLTFPILGWIEVVRVGILVLFQSSMGRLSAFQCWILCWLCIFHSFYYVYICSLCTHFGKSF